jgi:5-methylcytosine-specific restriction endonuclease McrA
MRARARAGYAANLEHYRAYHTEKQRAYREADPERIRQRDRASYAASPFRMREAARKRRALLANVSGPGLTESEWSEILEINDHRCAYCLEQSNSLEVDHIVALARGGSHSADNVVPACETCNTSKNDRSLLEIFHPHLQIEQRRTAPVA